MLIFHNWISNLNSHILQLLYFYYNSGLRCVLLKLVYVFDTSHGALTLILLINFEIFSVYPHV